MNSYPKIISKLDRPKNFCCLDKKFLIVYNFIGRIFDISSYIILFKDFSIYRTIFHKEMKHLNFDKLDKKFNINNIELMHNLEQKIFSYDSDNNDIFSKTILYHQHKETDKIVIREILFIYLLYQKLIIISEIKIHAILLINSHIIIFKIYN